MSGNDPENFDLSFLPLRIQKVIRATIRQALLELDKLPWPIQTVVLGGGYKNKEITRGRDFIASDIDLFVFSNFLPFFWKRLKRAGERIDQDGDVCFHYRGVVPFFLSKSKTFWAYRLKHEGIVLRGDPKILLRLGANERNIPQRESIRILFQILAVGMKRAELSDHREFEPYTVLRGYLYIGESYLTYAGKLAPSYRERLLEIDAVAQELNLGQELTEKIKAGYRVKMDYAGLEQERQRFDLTFARVKEDYLNAADHLLSLYLKSDQSLEEKIRLLAQEIRPKYILNLAFFFSLRSSGLKPRFLPIFLHFRITDLFLWIVYKERGKHAELTRLVRSYLKDQEFSETMLQKIFESHPLITTVEM